MSCYRILLDCTKPLTLALLASLLLAGCGDTPRGDAATDATPEPAPAPQTSHTLEQIADGVYFASSEGKGDMVLMSNALVIVNDDHVVAVDSHVSPESGRSLIAAIGSVTDLPVRYLVNTHFHFDHAHGNQSFDEGVDIVGHEYTRERMLGDVLQETTYLNIGSPAAIEGMVANLEASKAEMSEEEQASVDAQIAMWRRHARSQEGLEPTPPNVTLNDRLTLFRGGREIQIMHLGRGHTGGDVVVYLPADRIVFTGDLFYAGAPYLGDGFADEFVATLERLKALDVDLIVGGHGPLVRDKAQIEVTQNYLRDYWSQVQRSYRAGRSPEEAVAALDLSDYAEYAAFNINTPGVLQLEVNRMYERLRSQ